MLLLLEVSSDDTRDGDIDVHAIFNQQVNDFVTVLIELSLQDIEVGGDSILCGLCFNHCLFLHTYQTSMLTFCAKSNSLSLTTYLLDLVSFVSFELLFILCYLLIDLLLDLTKLVLLVLEGLLDLHVDLLLCLQE